MTGPELYIRLAGGGDIALRPRDDGAWQLDIADHTGRNVTIDADLADHLTTLAGISTGSYGCFTYQGRQQRGLAGLALTWVSQLPEVPGAVLAVNAIAASEGLASIQLTPQERQRLWDEVYRCHGFLPPPTN